MVLRLFYCLGYAGVCLGFYHLWGNFGGKFSGISSKRVSNVPFVYSKFCTHSAKAVMLKNTVLL